MDRAWDMFWIKSINGTSIPLQLKSFSPPKFELMRGLKSDILAIFRKGWDHSDLLVQPSRILHNHELTGYHEWDSFFMIVLISRKKLGILNYEQHCTRSTKSLATLPYYRHIAKKPILLWNVSEQLNCELFNMSCN